MNDFGEFYDLFLSFGLIGFGFLVGYLHGIETKQSYIQEAFSLILNIRYEDFYNVLGTYVNFCSGHSRRRKRKLSKFRGKLTDKEIEEYDKSNTEYWENKFKEIQEGIEQSMKNK